MNKWLRNEVDDALDEPVNRLYRHSRNARRRFRLDEREPTHRRKRRWPRADIKEYHYF